MMSGELVWLPVCMYSNLNYLIVEMCNFLVFYHFNKVLANG
jgi:hypothetical protein